jgi:hypothetical protein
MDFVPLLLGAESPCSLREAGRLQASTQKAFRLASALFGNARWWHPPLDDLLA